jgi:UDP-N-acetylmuramoyl-tripeptide--D-alanyl-D-alanine ligase
MENIKELVVGLLNRAIRSYITRNRIQVIAVAGSIGKTSTTSAIRTVLSQKYRVHFPKTTYNTNRSVHLELFDLPFATSTAGWVRMVALVLVRSLGKAPYEVLVIEIGTDHPGELRTFAWLKPDIGVLTAIAPEHMEHFGTIEAVAEEELAITGFSSRLVINANTVDRALVPEGIAAQAVWYGDGHVYGSAGYRLEDNRVTADFRVKEQRLEGVGLQVLGIHSLDALTAATTVGDISGLNAGEIRHGLEAVQPAKGRMQRLEGIKGATIIDDSYNASPEACRAALDVLVRFEAPQRIAVLGMMNEMGDYSERAHTEVGAYCDPERLDLVVTIGADANRFLAEAARARGCTVQAFDSPYEAGEYVRQQLQPDAVILFKGSQNGVFAEEAVKAVLADPDEIARLTRQSPYWMEKKRQQFGAPPAL